MKRIILMMAVCLVALSGSVQAQSITSQTMSPDIDAMVKRLAAEVKALRLEVATLRLEPQQDKIARLERELKLVRFEKRRMEQSEREYYEQMARLDARMSQSTLTQEEQSDLSAQKTALLAHSPEKVLVRLQQVTQREAELTERLQQEQELLQTLSEMVKKLSAELSDSQKP